MTEAYPLAWPQGRARSPHREKSAFGVSFAHARDGLLGELRLLGATHVVLSSNLALRRDGLPYANQPEPEDTGVACYFLYQGQQMCFACDRWNRARDNVRAIQLTIGALRGIARWGTGDMLAAAFTGFLAIEPPKRSWRSVIPGTSIDEVEENYRKLAQLRHPDHGGNEAAMAELNVAIQQARAELGA